MKHKSHVCPMENEPLGEFSRLAGSDLPSPSFCLDWNLRGLAAVGLVTTRGAGVRIQAPDFDFSLFCEFTSLTHGDRRLRAKRPVASTGTMGL